VDLVRDSVRVALQELIELEAAERIGAVRNAPGKGGQVVSMAVVVATGVTATGEPSPPPTTSTRRGTRPVTSSPPGSPSSGR
jgi:hypothetical protein